MKLIGLPVFLLAAALLGAGCGSSKPAPASSDSSAASAQEAAAAGSGENQNEQAAVVSANASSTEENPAPKQPAPKTIKKPAPSQPAAVSVLIGDTAFSPDIQVVQAGGKVFWTNKSAKSQTIHSVDSNLYDSGNIPPGKTWSRVFPASGSYVYYTASDANMKGTIIVR